MLTMNGRNCGRRGRTAMLASAAGLSLVAFASAAHAQATNEAAANPAAAQQATATPAAAIADQSGSTAPSAAGSATAPQVADGQIGDIVVTAQRRSENLQKAAVAIDVLTADSLQRAGLTAAQSLSTLTPGVQIGGSGAFTQIFIRGIGDRSNTFLSNASVSTNLDGVPLLRPTEVNGNFFDLQRVEILKGPQGTLYGRNATGGAINILTARPTQELGGYIDGEVGNYDLFKTDGAINVPVSDTLAFRTAFQLVTRKGYLTDGENDDKQENVRLSASWKPSNALSVFLSGGYSHQGGKGTGVSLVYPLCTAATGCLSPWTSVATAQVTTIRQNSFLPASAKLAPFPAPGYAPRLDNTNYYVTGQLDYDLGFATLTVLPSYHQDHYIANTYPGLVFSNDITARQTTVETRLSHDSTALKWVAGFFYAHENQTGINPVVQNVDGTGASTYNLLLGPGASIDSKAVFGQATYSLTSALRITGGIRYTDETSGLNEQEYFCSLAQCPGAFEFSLDKTFTTQKVTWKAGAEYDLAPDHFLYFNYSTGFKAGGLFTAPVANPVYQPEEIVAYTLGSRNRFLNGKLQVNLEAYRWDYSNQVYNFVGPVPGLNYVTLVFLNIGAGRVQGASADIAAKPWRGGTFRVAADYADSRYSSFSYDALVGQRGLANQTCAVGATHVNGAGVPVQTIDCSGKPFILTPKVSGSASFDQEFGFSNGSAVDLGVTAGFTTSRYSQFDFLPSELLPSTMTVDLDATWRSPSGKVSIGAYIHNVGNVITYSQAQSLTGTAGAAAPAGGPVIGGTIGAPRTGGVKASIKF